MRHVIVDIAFIILLDKNLEKSAFDVGQNGSLFVHKLIMIKMYF